MAITESSNLKPKETQQLYCQIRRTWVASLPEENVRQGVLSLLIDQLGYPLGCIALEKSLQQMPHLAGKGLKLPTRRADIVCFTKDLTPLLLIECKAVPLTDKVINQAIGYNYFLAAPFVGVANAEHIRTGWYDPHKGAYTFVDGIPSYREAEARAGKK